MKIQNIARAAGIAAAAALALSGCTQPTDSSTSYAGTATKLFVAHGGGYIGEATVTTNANGVVTDAVMNEYHGPSGWADYKTGLTAYEGGEMIRMKMASKNTTNASAEIAGYTFFYYSVNAQGWVEFTPSLTETYTAPTGTTNVKENFNAKMANPLYAEAYVADVKADNDTDLVTITMTDGGGTGSGTLATITVGAKASDTCHYISMNKAASDAIYMPMNATSIGYRENVKALLTFFKSNPTADYASAVATTGVALGAMTTDYVGTVEHPVTTADYSAATDTVWEVADVVTGATYSDFQSYALELQNAYLFALSDIKGGDLRSVR